MCPVTALDVGWETAMGGFSEARGCAPSTHVPVVTDESSLVVYFCRCAFFQILWVSDVTVSLAARFDLCDPVHLVVCHRDSLLLFLVANVFGCRGVLSF